MTQPTQQTTASRFWIGLLLTLQAILLLLILTKSLAVFFGIHLYFIYAPFLFLLSFLAGLPWQASIKALFTTGMWSSNTAHLILMFLSLLFFHGLQRGFQAQLRGK
ncbi:MAG: hypothetical protein AAGJ35_04250 [Myxococcota bacterium]